MVVRCVKRQEFTIQGFVFRDERAPDIQAGNHILKISSHAHTDLLDLILLKRIGKVCIFQHIVNTVCDICIIEIC